MRWEEREVSGWIPRVGRLFDVIVWWKMSDVFGRSEGEDSRSRRATEVSSQEVSIPRTTIFLR